jgi:hypothetical protein
MQVLPDLVLDLPQTVDRALGIGLDPVTERLDLEDGGRDGLRETVVDLHRPARALFQQPAFDRGCHGRMHALRGGRRCAGENHVLAPSFLCLVLARLVLARLVLARLVPAAVWPRAVVRRWV